MKAFSSLIFTVHKPELSMQCLQTETVSADKNAVGKQHKQNLQFHCLAD
jgi:hypothetical protein